MEQLEEIANATLNMFEATRLKSKTISKKGNKYKVTTLNPNHATRVLTSKLVNRYEIWAAPIRVFLRKYSYETAKHFDDCFEATKSYVLQSRVGTDLTPNVWRNLFVKEFTSLIELQKKIIMDADAKFNFRRLNFFCYKNNETCSIPARFNSKLIFVLMPFSDDYTDVYEVGIKPIVESFKLLAVRADEIQHSREILCGSICQPIQECKFLIADLSERNPNVFYELGLAHGFEKEIILLSNNIDDVPFDLRGMNIIIYNNVSILRKKLKYRMTSLINPKAQKTEMADRNGA